MQLLAVERTGAFLYLVCDDLGADYMTNQDAGEQRHDRHEHGVGDKVKEVEELHTDNGDRCPRTIAETGQHANDQAACRNSDGSRLALHVCLVHQHGNQCFHQRNGGGQRRKQYEQEEYRADNGAELHGVEYHRQSDEHQTRTAVYLRRIAAVERDNRRNDHQTGHKREQRVENLNLSDRVLKQIFLLHVGAVGDHNTHCQRHRVEHLSHRTKHGRYRKLREIGQNIIFQALQRTRNGQRVDCDNDRQNGENRHHDTACLLDALLNTKDNDNGGRQHEQDEPRGRSVEAENRRGQRTRIVANEIAEKSAVVGRLKCVAADKGEQVFHNPSADNTVIRRDDERHERRQPAEESEPLIERLVRTDTGQTGLSSDGNLGNHQ